jgi:NAD(P)-dependent dehydrogenase (short-subunit alcohol dehydrogenase family)
MPFTGRNALVTGSARGIGRGIALKPPAMGASVAVHYQDRGAAIETLEQVRELGPDGFLVQADVCQPDEVRRAFEQFRSEFGSLDIFSSATHERRRRPSTNRQWVPHWENGTLRLTRKPRHF